MKKILLLICVMMAALASNATVYTLYDMNVKESGWFVNDDDQFELNTMIRGAEFDFITAKDPRQSMYVPGQNNFPIRLQKDLGLSISSSVVMKEVKFTFVGAIFSTYAAQGTVSEGWTQGEVQYDESSDTPYTMVITNTAGSKDFSFISSEKQVMIQKIEVTDSEFNDDETETPDVVLTSIEDLYMNANPGDLVKVDCDLTVAYAYGRDIYATDKDGRFIHILGPEDYGTGLVISKGWMGSFSITDGFFPMINGIDCPKPNASKKEEFKPRAVSAEIAIDPMYLMDLVNNVFVIQQVELAKATPYDAEGLYNDSPFIGTSQGVDLIFRNKYNLASVPAGKYDITVLFAHVDIDEEWNVTPQFYVISFAKATETGVEVNAAEAAPAVYYNLQGMRVENPVKGIFIRMESGKSTKVIL